MDQVMNMPTNQGQATGQSLSNGLLEDNYPRNMWWVAARGDEVGEKPLAGVRVRQVLQRKLAAEGRSLSG
jgi:hypothetical protein